MGPVDEIFRLYQMFRLHYTYLHECPQLKLCTYVIPYPKYTPYIQFDIVVLVA